MACAFLLYPLALNTGIAAVYQKLFPKVALIALTADTLLLQIIQALGRVGGYLSSMTCRTILCFGPDDPLN
jgi:hypothetical protein